MGINKQENTAEFTRVNSLACELASLGYPGLAYLKKERESQNPAETLIKALSVADLDSRLVEALPWVLLNYAELDWEWLMLAAKARQSQNRLGFITNVARRLAEARGEFDKAALLARHETELERSRLEREDTLCHDSLTEAEKRWLRERRPDDAKRWRLLTDLSPEHLAYAV